MEPVNVYVAPRSLRIAMEDEDAENLVNYIFHALEKVEINQVLKLKLSDVDIITYPCLMYIIRRLSQEMSKGGKYYNKFMVIQDLSKDSYYRKEMVETITGVIDKLELPILLIEPPDSKVEFKILGSIFHSNPYLEQVYNLIRQEEKSGNSLITPNILAKKLNQPQKTVSHILRRLHSFRLLIREHIISTGKSGGEYCYFTVVSRALENK